MKIYSILVHPNQGSLNLELFDLANRHFKKNGHKVKTFDLYRSTDKLINAATTLTQSDKSIVDRKHMSTYTHNYTMGQYEQLADSFAKDEIKKLKEADLLFIQTPIFVWSMPAMLKLYIENVFLYNELFALTDSWSDKNFKIDKFMTNKKILFSITTGSSQGMTKSVLGSTNALTQPIRSMFEFVGYEWLDPYITWGTTKSRDICDEYVLNFDNYLKEVTWISK